VADVSGSSLQTAGLPGAQAKEFWPCRPRAAAVPPVSWRRVRPGIDGGNSWFSGAPFGLVLCWLRPDSTKQALPDSLGNHLLLHQTRFLLPWMY
jgi:hypothetical protein